MSNMNMNIKIQYSKNNKNFHHPIGWTEKK